MNRPAAADWLVLRGAECCAVLELSPGEAPLWRAWGPALPDGVFPPSGLRATRSTPSFSLDHDQPLSLMPTFGVGWFGAPALRCHRAGLDFAQAFTASDVTVLEPERSALVRLTDPVAGLEAQVRLEMDVEASTLSLTTTLANLGTTPLQIAWLAAGVLPLPPEATEVRSTVGRHNREFIPQTDRLGRNGWSRENRRGLTSHDMFPGAVVMTEGASRQSGLVYAAQLAWSGNHAQRIEWLDDGRWQWQLGEWLAPGEVILAPGGTLTTPELLATCSTGGLDGAAQNFHRAVRRRLSWPGGGMRPRPVHLNTWEGFYFDHRQDALMTLADRAAAVGIERFVLDDGWFHGRRDDKAGLGDWWPDAEAYPQGLKPLADHVTGLGMRFGLWVEPEMVNPDSDLFRAHPDWALQLDGRPMLTARNQLVLDLSREEVRTCLLDRLGALLDSLPIDYLKWDHNRDLTTAGHHGRAAYRGQVLGAWRLMDTLRARWPEVEIEACAGGGGRIDAGILRRCHRFWTSDCIDAVSRLEIQDGFLQFMPPELMGAHVGAAPAHATGRSQSLDFRAGVALPGHLGVEFDLTRLDDAGCARLADWIALYKRLRDRLHTGRVWRGDAGDGVRWQAHGEADDLIMLVWRVAPTGQRYPPSVRLPMLAGTGPRRVARLAPGEEPEAARSDLMAGSWLAAVGLPLPPMPAETCLIFQISRELT